MQNNYKIDIKDFILVADNLFDEEYCKSVILFFEDAKTKGFGSTRKKEENSNQTYKDDSFLFTNHTLLRESNYSNEFYSKFWAVAYNKYAEKYGALENAEKHFVYDIKIQKTEIGQGYHVWHFENDSRRLGNRLMAWILYLNDVDEGGETEFLYYPRRVKPKQGTLIIFPAAFTHTHRGNPPISNTKYIATGWVEF